MKARRLRIEGQGAGKDWIAMDNPPGAGGPVDCPRWYGLDAGNTHHKAQGGQLHSAGYVISLSAGLGLAAQSAQSAYSKGGAGPVDCPLWYGLDGAAIGVSSNWHVPSKYANLKTFFKIKSLEEGFGKGEFARLRALLDTAFYLAAWRRGGKW